MNKITINKAMKHSANINTEFVYTFVIFSDSGFFSKYFMNEKINNNDVSKYRYVFATYRSHVWNDENRVIMKNNNVIMYIASIYFSLRNKILPRINEWIKETWHIQRLEK